MQALYALLYLGVLGGIYGLVYWLNKKTPVPPGCEDLKADCAGCKISSCGNYTTPTLKEQEGKL